MSARNTRKLKKRSKNAMNKSIDKLTLTTLKHSRLKKWARKWMNSQLVKKKCMRSRNSRSAATKMKSISERKKSTDLKGKLAKEMKTLKT